MSYPAHCPPDLPPPPQRNLSRWIILFGLLILAGSWCLVLFIIQQDRQIEITQVRKETRNLAIVFEQHVSDSFSQIESTLSSIRTHYESHHDTAHLHSLLRHLVNFRPELFNLISIIDAEGKVQLTSQEQFKPTYSGDRPFFVFHQRHSERRMQIGTPLLGRVTGKWYIPVSLRLHDREGRFAGVLLASVNPGYFSSFFERASLGKQALTYLADADGVLYSGLLGKQALPLDKKIDPLDAVQSLRRNGHSEIVEHSSMDGVQRIRGRAILRDRPMFVSVEVGLHESLQYSAFRTIFLLLAQGLISILVLFFLFRLRAAIQEKDAFGALLEQKTAALHESEEFRQRAFEASNVPIVIMDAQTLRYIDCNPAAVRIGGYDSREAMLAQTPGQHADLLQYDGTPSGVKALEFIAQARAEGSVDFEWRHRRPNGEIWDAQVHLICFHSGEHELLQFTLQDITARKRAEQKLREKDNELQRYFDSSLDLLCIADEAGHFVRLNPEWEKCLGYTTPELEGRFFIDFVHPDDVASTLEAVARLRRQEEVLSFENRYRAKDGSYRWIEWRSKTVGKTIYAVARDISQRKAAEAKVAQLNQTLEARVRERTADLEAANQQLEATLATLKQAQDHLVQSEKLASLGALVAGVAHELNTPMGNAYMISTSLREIGREFTTAFEKGALKRSSLQHYVQQVNEAAELVSRNLQRASEMITQFKQVTADQTSAQRRKFELRQNIEEVLSTLQPQFKHTSHQLVVEIPPGLHFDSYPGPLGQVVTNIVFNALFHAFTEEENGVITVRAEALDAGQVRLTLSDNGCGIPAENLGRIFDPFFTTRLGSGGTGLGLHIVYNTVTRILGGRIDVRSAPGEGCSFTLEIPCVAPEQATPPDNTE